METLTLPSQEIPAAPHQEQLNPVAMAQLENMTVPTELSTLPQPVAEHEGPGEAHESRVKRMFRKVGQLVVRESLGAAVDIALLAVGPGSVSAREVMASSFDMAVANKQAGGEQQTDQTEQIARHRKLGRAATNFALGIGTAIVAQKYGPEMVDHINSNLNNGVGEMLVPIGSKLGALAGVTKARKVVGL